MLATSSEKTPKRVLITDDESDVRSIMQQILTREGYLVTEAEDGKECIKARRADSNIDLVILDIIMPEQEGIETLRVIKQEFANTKILMVSGGGRMQTGQYLSLARTLGADEILAKPFAAKELVSAIDGILAPDNQPN